VKNACPNADKTMCLFNFVISGLNIYSKPKFALGNLKETITKNIKITASKGIKILLADSIPFFIPLAVTNKQINKNTKVKTHGYIGLWINREKYSS
jgi:hypothetical protein